MESRIDLLNVHTNYQLNEPILQTIECSQIDVEYKMRF
jgi:hypothetical protein